MPITNTYVNVIQQPFFLQQAGIQPIFAQVSNFRFGAFSSRYNPKLRQTAIFKNVYKSIYHIQVYLLDLNESSKRAKGGTFSEGGTHCGNFNNLLFTFIFLANISVKYAVLETTIHNSLLLEIKYFSTEMKVKFSFLHTVNCEVV